MQVLWILSGSPLSQGVLVTSISSVQFSHSVVSDSTTPWIVACQASMSITNSLSSLRLTSIESVMPSSHLILCRPLLLLPPVCKSDKSFDHAVFVNVATHELDFSMFWSERNLTSLWSLKRIETSVSATLIPSHHDCGIISPHYSRHVKGQVSLNSAPTVFGKWLRLGRNIILRPRQRTLHPSLESPLQYFVCPHQSLETAQVSSDIRTKYLGTRSDSLCMTNTECTYSNVSKLRSARTHSNTCVQPNPILLLVWNPVFLSYLRNSLTFHPEHGIIKVLQETPTCHYFCCPRANRDPTSWQVA